MLVMLPVGFGRVSPSVNNYLPVILLVNLISLYSYVYLFILGLVKWIGLSFFDDL